MYGRFWVSRASTPPVLLDGNILSSAFGRTWQNTVGVGQRHLHPAPEPAEQPGRDVQPDEQLQLPDLSRPTTRRSASTSTTTRRRSGSSTSPAISASTAATRTRSSATKSSSWTPCAGRRAGTRSRPASTTATARATSSTTSAPTAGSRSRTRRRSPAMRWPTSTSGKFSSFEQAIGEYKNTRMHFLATFVQDTFRVNRQLTLNLGLALGSVLPLHRREQPPRLLSARARSRRSTSTRRWESVYPGDAACPDGGYDASWADFGPRVGVAYDPFGDGKSSIRAGYGMFYDRPNTISTNSPANQGPFGTLVTFTGDGVNNMANPYAGRDEPVPGRSVQRAGGRAVLPAERRVQLRPEPEERPAPVVERHARARDHADVSGARRATPARRATAWRWAASSTPPIYAPGATTATTNQRRPLFPTFGNITTIESTGRSLYHSLQLTLDKRMSKRFSVLSSYTLSKNQDHAGEAKQTGATQTNPFDLEFDWGYANADRRHRLVTSALWQIPGEFDNAVLDGGAERLVADRHPRHAERRRLHRDERRRQRPHRHGRSARRHLRRSRAVRPIGRTAEKILAVVQHVGVRAERAGHVRQLGAQQPPRARLEERRSGPAQDVRDRRAARSCRCASRRSTRSTG